MTHATIHFDGACTGNPGPMGAGAVVETPAGKQTLSEDKGKGTNNEAEYHGLILGLRGARDAGAKTVLVRGDSQLVIRHIQGRYRVKAANLQPLFREAMTLIGEFEDFRAEWVPRDQNGEADAAARAGIA